MRYLLRPLSLLALLPIVACGGESSTTPTPGGGGGGDLTLSARGIQVVDVGNANAASDLLVTFNPAFNHLQVQEYRVVVSPTSTLDLDAALALPAARYRVGEIVRDTARVHLAGMLDTDGAAITEGKAYSVRVLSIGPDAQNPGDLTQPVAITLANEATVFTFGTRFAGGTGGVSTDVDGSILMADFVGSVYRVQPDGSQTVISEGHQTPSGNLPWEGGAFLQANYADGTIDLVQSDGSKSLWAEGLSGPVGMIRASNGDVLVTNCNNNRISRITPSGTISTFSESDLFVCPNSITTDGNDNFFVVNFQDGAVVRLDSNGAASTISTIEGFGSAHVIYRDDQLYITGRNARRIYRMNPAGGVAEPIAGTGDNGASDGPALAATLVRPNGIAISPDGRFIYWNEHLGDVQNAYSAGPAVLRRLEFARQ